MTTVTLEHPDQLRAAIRSIVMRSFCLTESLRCAMSEFLSAIYESGAFHPLSRPQLDDGEQVEILIRPRRLLQPNAVAAELAGAAAMPVACPGDPQTSQEHDRVLYGEAHSL